MTSGSKIGTPIKPLRCHVDTVTSHHYLIDLTPWREFSIIHTKLVGYRGDNKLPTTTTLRDEILKKKDEIGAVILSHSYQPGEIQELGDFVGDSLGLCIEAAETDAKVIVFCGVRFMAESAKLLNPEKTVLLPVPDAGCPMADMATPEAVRMLKERHPGAMVVTYVNSSAEVKAESDICCTSSNAVRVVESIPRDTPIIFVPDRNLGQWVAEQTGRDLILWEGFCPVHARFSAEDVLSGRVAHPDAQVLVHPECDPSVTAEADYVGSTEGMFQYCKKAEKGGEFIIGTEIGLIERLGREVSRHTYIPLSGKGLCVNMKKIHPEDVLKSMERMQRRVELDAGTIERAMVPLRRMMDLR